MEHPYEHLAVFFKQLAHPVRLQILNLLRDGEICVCNIEAALNKRQAYVSQQLMFLRESGLVDCRREGSKIYYRLANPMLEAVLAAVLETHEVT